MEIGWNNSPANGMAHSLAVNPNATGAGAAAPPAGAVPPVDPITGQPIYNPSGVPGATPITPPAAADPTQYYRPPARTDPRYIPADPHWTPQQRAAYEAAVNSGPAGHEAAAAIGAASWADWDQRRVQAGNDEAARRLAWKASLAPSTQTGVDAPLYDPDTDTYSIVDKDGKWTHGLGAKDVYAHLTADVQKQYPEWYFPEYAVQQEQNKRTNLDAAAYTNESFAKMGQQTTRYAATGL